MKKKELKIKDKFGQIIKVGDIISYKKRIFDVIKYDGFIKEMKSKLKIMERKSMFEGAIDYWLEDLIDEENKIEIIDKL